MSLEGFNLHLRDAPFHMSISHLAIVCVCVFKCPFKFFLFLFPLLHTFLLVLFYD